MNKILWTKDYTENKITDLTVKYESVTIYFEEGDVTFNTYHQQDCCEEVYGDFSIVQYHKEKLVGKILVKIEVKAIEGMGFLLCFTFDWEVTEKIFIPCYNSQNGYYSDDLSLIISEGSSKIEINISDLVEDYIN